jgi:signal recognition particle subunit SRP72
MPTLSKTEKLFEHQENILRKNRYVIDLQTNKHEGVTRSTSKFLSQKQLPTTSTFINIISAIGAAAVAHSDNIKSAIKKLLPLLEKRQNDVGLVLTVVQLYISVNNHAQAISVLEAFLEKLEASHSPEDLDVRFTPGLVALIVSLYRTKGRKVPMKTELAKAASHWKQKSAPAEELLKAAGLSLLESSKADDLAAAGELFGSLRKQDPESRLAIAGLVASHATTNISLVKSDLEKLTPVDRMVADIDTAALEAGGVASLPITMSDASKKRAAPAEKEKPAKKRARKSKLPKDYVEGKQMDPERWLPLKDRSTYRPKGKKGKKKAMDSTQGGVVKDEEGLELTAGSGVVRVEKAGGGGKAKKKKGKK